MKEWDLDRVIKELTKCVAKRMRIYGSLSKACSRNCKKTPTQLIAIAALGTDSLEHVIRKNWRGKLKDNDLHARLAYIEQTLRSLQGMPEIPAAWERWKV